MKKKMMMLLVGVLVIASLAGCGKSEQEKLVERINQEIANDESANAEYREQKEDRDDIINNAFNAYMQEIIDVYELYTNATTADEIKEYAEKYNELYDNYMSDVSGVNGEQAVRSELFRKINYSEKISETEIESKISSLSD